jgi:hypothetical protein
MKTSKYTVEIFLILKKSMEFISASFRIHLIKNRNGLAVRQNFIQFFNGFSGLIEPLLKCFAMNPDLGKINFF